MAKSYGQPDLPSTKKKGFWNPDGNALQQSVTLRPLEKREHGLFTVKDGHVVCTACQNHHSIPTRDISKFIERNKEKFLPLPRIKGDDKI